VDFERHHYPCFSSLDALTTPVNLPAEYNEMCTIQCYTVRGR
jgi:hypothetical protein